MKTNRLSDKITTALNEQMTKKHMPPKYTYHIAWADNNGFSGIANFLSVMQQRNETI
jgi:ferritin